MRTNIYPRTLENIKAVLLYYFPNEKHSAINDFAATLYDDRKLELNEIEFIAEIINTNQEVFDSLFKKNYINVLETFFNSAHQALFDEENEWSGSDNRLIILKTIKDQLC
jgi:hypothetical protein